MSKRLLRFKDSMSPLTNFTEGSTFRPVIGDTVERKDNGSVKRIVMCSGQVYYDLDKARQENGLADDIAIIRVEQLYPFPEAELTKALKGVSVRKAVWVQDEPQNMGAWTYAAPRLTAVTGTELAPRYVGRPERASPAEGYLGSHQEEQARIVKDALAGVPQREKVEA